MVHYCYNCDASRPVTIRLTYEEKWRVERVRCSVCRRLLWVESYPRKLPLEDAYNKEIAAL